MTNNFNFQATITGACLSLRPLLEDDFEELFACASDKQIWAGHPQPDRYTISVFRPYFQAAIDAKNCLVVIDNSCDNIPDKNAKNTSGKIIGSSRFYHSKTIPDDISIGFTFLAREYWGGQTNLELKELMLNYAFKYLTTVWFHIGVTNIRSQKATLKIGATFSHEETLDISGKDETWFCYKIERDTRLKIA